jgi:hypothetical protein
MSKNIKTNILVTTLCAARGDDDDDDGPPPGTTRVGKRRALRVDGSKARVVVSVPRDEGVRHSFSL